ncbi:hypothetical protein SAMN05444366_0416 [Flavobacterium saccharophilum]|uniref:Uncharacterized protein n=1 Tax=Flavobacterium saccharophilum TaxID=29534 RepID=A0A1M6ZVF2_9FLAO|nr:hypothetical protein SAMN05444366_0416 [Flavobacterium saccharophilum]
MVAYTIMKLSILQYKSSLNFLQNKNSDCSTFNFKLLVVNRTLRTRTVTDRL